MSNFKKGDLVEVIGSVSFPQFIRERFILTSYDSVCYNEVTKEVLNIKNWRSPFRVDGLEREVGFLEEHLKKINPDTDEKSNFTFEELMDKMKSEQLEGV